MTLPLPLVDPDVAAVTFQEHLDAYWESRQLDQLGWNRLRLDALTVVVTIPATAEGAVLPVEHHVRLGAEHYDLNPPTVKFVAPLGVGSDQESCADHTDGGGAIDDGWHRARAGTTWWPRIQPPGWFGLHDDYQYRGNGYHFRDQLVCFSMTAEYQLGHSPTAEQAWVQGERTVAATLSRLAEVLAPPYYQGPDAPRTA